MDDEWRAEEPDAPRTEAAALTLLESRPLPTPRLVALGEVDGIPLLLMTRLPGALVCQPTDVVLYVVATLGGREQEDLACLDAGDRALLQRAVAER